MKQKLTYSVPCSETVILAALQAMMEGTTQNISGPIEDTGTTPNDDSPV